MARALSNQSLINMMPSPSAKKKRTNCSYGEVDKSITNIKSGDISQAKTFLEYGVPCQTLARKCKKKIDNSEKKRPGLTPVLGEEAEKYFLQCALVMQKHGLPMGRGMIIPNSPEIHCLVYGSMCSAGLMVRGWCDQFMNQHIYIDIKIAPIHQAGME